MHTIVLKLPLEETLAQLRQALAGTGLLLVQQLGPTQTALSWSDPLASVEPGQPLALAAADAQRQLNQVLAELRAESALMGLVGNPANTHTNW
ncbi:hypothetical protein QMK33_21410 [Hymenobacter sp. H14-R3]|uniref:hypothetical protein n=1 Tax=Hymenobacter sp. H14-R3 TaxID=3046308 RepID=UPI0024BBA807|nr:hypothetical protein [Hymenobacter sp. H14-R3]MDJ0367712.1 hypothetical protein [Hymenobacter sp. H14-R3]